MIRTPINADAPERVPERVCARIYNHVANTITRYV